MSLEYKKGKIAFEHMADEQEIAYLESTDGLFNRKRDNIDDPAIEVTSTHTRTADGLPCYYFSLAQSKKGPGSASSRSSGGSNASGRTLKSEPGTPGKYKEARDSHKAITVMVSKMEVKAPEGWPSDTITVKKRKTSNGQGKISISKKKISFVTFFSKFKGFGRARYPQHFLALKSNVKVPFNKCYEFYLSLLGRLLETPELSATAIGAQFFPEGARFFYYLVRKNPWTTPDIAYVEGQLKADKYRDATLRPGTNFLPNRQMPPSARYWGRGRGSGAPRGGRGGGRGGYQSYQRPRGRGRAKPY